jgi:hypothetical protein
MSRGYNIKIYDIFGRIIAKSNSHVQTHRHIIVLVHQI